jgi:hypothetical protein
VITGFHKARHTSHITLLYHDCITYHILHYYYHTSHIMHHITHHASHHTFCMGGRARLWSPAACAQCTARSLHVLRVHVHRDRLVLLLFV